jgi:hypothetical protein
MTCFLKSWAPQTATTKSETTKMLKIRRTAGERDIELAPCMTYQFGITGKDGDLYQNGSYQLAKGGAPLTK